MTKSTDQHQHGNLIVLWAAFGAVLLFFTALPSLIGPAWEITSPAAALPAWRSLHSSFFNEMGLLALLTAALAFGLYALAKKSFYILILCWSLNEVVVLFGFALSTSLKTPQAIWPFAGAGLALHFLMYPRRGHNEEQKRVSANF